MVWSVFLGDANFEDLFETVSVSNLISSVWKSEEEFTVVEHFETGTTASMGDESNNLLIVQQSFLRNKFLQKDIF